VTRYLVVGSPVAHSLSPVMMNAAFARAGIDALYEAAEIPPGRWPDEMRRLFDEGIGGVNVTVPLKEPALRQAAAASGVAREIGAANVLARGEGGWVADNTDGPGFLEWVEAVGASPRAEALVLGAGGSARAVVWALLSGGSPRVRVANRTRARAEALARDLEEAMDAPGRIVVEDPGRAAPEGGLVVNCTSLGLREDDPLPLAPEKVRRAGRALDLVYPETRWVAAARREGVAAEAGLGLLVAQAARSFRRWTSVAPDRAVMLAAAQDEIARRSERAR
jgi:shikimate dehydrogenase